jgi:hypothetical protein
MTTVPIPSAKLERKNRNFPAVALACLSFCVQSIFDPISKCMNERTKLFDLTTLSFELYVHKHHAFLTSSISENRKGAEY